MLGSILRRGNKEKHHLPQCLLEYYLWVTHRMGTGKYPPQEKKNGIITVPTKNLQGYLPMGIIALHTQCSNLHELQQNDIPWAQMSLGERLHYKKKFKIKVFKEASKTMQLKDIILKKLEPTR